MSELKETVAKNVGVSLDTLNTRIEEVLTENKSAWISAGKSDDDCTVLAIRVAGRQLKAEAAKTITKRCRSPNRYVRFSSTIQRLRKVWICKDEEHPRNS